MKHAETKPLVLLPPVQQAVGSLCTCSDKEAEARLSTDRKQAMRRYYTEKGRLAHKAGLGLTENPLLPMALTTFGRELAAAWARGWESVKCDAVTTTQSEHPPMRFRHQSPNQ